MSTRRRVIETVHVPVNPCYIEHWRGAVTVADAINNTFEAALGRAIDYGTRFGAVTIIMPLVWKNCSPNVKVFLNSRLRTLFEFAESAGAKYNCIIHVSDVRRTSAYVEMCESAFHNNDFVQDVFEIPTHWDDCNPDYTWSELCDSGQCYASSSKDVWPPTEYKRQAELEKVRKARTARLDPFARYYAQHK